MAMNSLGYCAGTDGAARRTAAGAAGWCPGGKATRRAACGRGLRPSLLLADALLAAEAKARRAAEEAADAPPPHGADY